MTSVLSPDPTGLILTDDPDAYQLLVLFKSLLGQAGHTLPPIELTREQLREEVPAEPEASGTETPSTPTAQKYAVAISPGRVAKVHAVRLAPATSRRRHYPLTLCDRQGTRHVSGARYDDPLTNVTCSQCLERLYQDHALERP